MTLKYAASYARKSTPDDIGISDQHALNAQAAQANGFCIPSGPQFRFEDDDTSGVTKSRNGLDHLRRTVESGAAPFETVFIKDRSRLGRFEDAQRSAYLEVCFRDHNSPLRFVHTLTGTTSGLPQHSMVEAIAATIEAVTATRSREELIERVVGGLRARVCRGRFPLTVAPYATERCLIDEASGLELERIEPGRPVRRAGCTFGLRLGAVAEQEVVRRIYANVSRGDSFRSIAVALNSEGIAAPKPGRHPTAGWTAAKIVDLVRNPIYMGDLVYGRTSLTGSPVDHKAARIDDTTPIRVAGFVPPIVSSTIWEATQAVLDHRAADDRARRGAARTFLLSGLLRCVHCGARYSGGASSKLRGVTPRRYYRHDPRRRGNFSGRCPARNRYIRAEALESGVTTLLHQLADDPALQRAVEEAFERDRAAAVGPDLTNRMALLVRERDAIAATIRRLLLVRLEDTSADAAVVLQQVVAEHGGKQRQVEEALRALEGTRRAWAAAQRNWQPPTGSDLIATALDHPAPEEQRQIVHQAVAAIRVDADGPDVEVVLHTFADLTGAKSRPKAPEPHPDPAKEGP